MSTDLSLFKDDNRDESRGKSNGCVRGYDIVGDVHGCAHTLARLLKKLGYDNQDGYYKHPIRKVIFVGDIVDRGPHITEALKIVKDMVDHKSAQCILGNHEINALAYTTQINEHESEGDEPIYVRAHNARNNRQIAETLTQFAAHPELWREYLQWFLTLPLYIEVDGVRIVHACWDEEIIATLERDYNGPFISRDFLIRSHDKGSFEARAIDILTRGTDLPMPNNRTITGSDGYVRSFFRTKFWAHNPKKFKDVVFQPDPLPNDLLEHPLDSGHNDKLLRYDTTANPVFVGHYWLQGKPKPIKDNIACVDYSAVKYGRLVAYRFSGEKKLQEENFEWVYVDPL